MNPKETYTTAGKSRWTLLLIDGRGRIRRLRGLRQMVAATVGLVLALICGVAVFAVLWAGRTREHQQVLSALDQVQEQISVLKADNQSLLARVVVAENRVQADAHAPPVAARTPKPAPVPEPTPVSPEPAPLPVTAPAQSTAPAQTTGQVTAPAASNQTSEVPGPKEAALVDAVEIEKLTLSLDAADRRIAARFMLRNSGANPVEGRSVVVLRTDGDEVWQTLPEVSLADGKPRGDRGRRFSIRRFMNVKLDGDVVARGVRLATAEVYVFSEEGRLLNEKRFAVDLEVPTGSTPSRAPENQTP